MEDELSHSNTLTGIGENSLEASVRWEGFTEFIWTSAAKRHLGEMLYDISEKRTGPGVLKTYLFFTSCFCSRYSELVIHHLVFQTHRIERSVRPSKQDKAGDDTVVACLSAARFIGGESRVPLKMRGIPESTLWFARRHWECLWRTVLLLPLLSHGRWVMGWWVYLKLGITWLQCYTQYSMSADSSSKALARDGRKEINESPRISAQPFLLSFD